LPDAPDATPRHTAATAPQMVDGASLVLIGTAAAGEQLGLKPRARVAGYGSAGVRPPLLTATAPAVRRALDAAGFSAADVDLWEVNESFAATVLHLTGTLGLNLTKVNVDGGAMALGHPLGATGGILLATLLDALERTGGTIGVLTIAAASGIGAALVIERC
jgi:acetyl-CoA C-acetyltransferase